MSFDPRSLERLRQLGRTLPQPLPVPQAPPPAAPKASERRHRVETETDPEVLFRELMQVSPDGTVPPHLMDRLREAEQQRQQRRQEERRRPAEAAARPTAPPTGRPGELRPAPRRRQPASDEELQLYTEFQALLLEGDEAG